MENLLISENQVIDKTTRDRIVWLDVARGIGIVLMVAGHIGYGKLFDHWIHAFHMPLFFFISGYLYVTPSSFGKFLKKKMKTLLVPYISFGIIYWIIFCVFVNGKFDVSPLIRLCTFNHKGLAISGAIWFFTASFFANILYYLINEKIKLLSLRVISIVVVSLIGSFFYLLTGVRLPWSLDAAFVGVGFLAVGHIYKNKYKIIRDKYGELNSLKIVVLFAINFVMIFCNGLVNMRLALYSNVLLFWVNAVIAIIILFNVSKKIGQHKFLLCNFSLNELKFIGNNSVIYLCINQAIILIFNSIWNLYGIDNVLLLGVYKILILIIVLMLLHGVSYLISNTKLKFLVGK